MPPTPVPRFPVVVALVLAALAVGRAAPVPLYLDPGQPVDARAHDLVSRMTLDEKASLMRNGSPGVPRLGVPKYDWWNEALHGVARAGHATVFPQAIGLAAMWDDALLHQIAGVIGTEARAKYNSAASLGKAGDRYYGLTFWSPNINIFRDPRWGRGQETYGEDPFLTARLGVAFVKGLQGDDPKYLMAVACAKHFVVHSGPESLRHNFDVEPDPADFHDTYLPAFEALVREGHVGGIMTAYNSVYGKPCAINPILYGLLQSWGFNGYVTSDCQAIRDLNLHYKVAADDAGAEALAIRAGLCLRCGEEAPAIADAVRRGLVTEAEVDRSLEQLLKTMFRLGIFDSPDLVPYSKIPASANDTFAHGAVALQAASEAMVLLKNDGTLPLQWDQLRRVTVVGPNADSLPALRGNYFGEASAPVTVLAGLRAALEPNVKVDYVRGCNLADATPVAGGTNSPKPLKGEGPDVSTDFAGAVASARGSDLVIFVGGLTANVEGEEMKVNYPGFAGGDRSRIELPDSQAKLLAALKATGKPVVFVLMSGSAVALPGTADQANAILEAWYPGQAGGTAVADILLGRTNPSGRLPVTFYRATADLPAFEDYGMKNRTYRYFAGVPLYPFGFGLSYTKFEQSFLNVVLAAPGSGAAMQVSVRVENTGDREGDEVVQLYAQAPAESHPRDRESLCGFRRVHLKAGEAKTVAIDVPVSALRRWDEPAKAYRIPVGEWKILAGSSSADIHRTTPITVDASFAAAVMPQR